jgi:hypothetical protein
MKLLCFIIVAALTVATRADFDAPTFENSEEMRSLSNNLHFFLDALVWNNAFKWANGTTGLKNLTRLEEMKTTLTAYLTTVTTPTFRLCERLGDVCYVCENGATNVSNALVNVMADAKLYGEVHNMMDSVSLRTDLQTFTLHQNNNAMVLTATLPCRAVPTCFPNNTDQLIKGELYGERLTTFKRIAGKMLIESINVGSRFNYFAPSETGLGVRILITNFGMGLVPQAVVEGTLTGIFCFAPSKRRTNDVVYYAHRGLSMLEKPY